MRPRFVGGGVDLRPEDIVRLEVNRVVLLDEESLPQPGSAGASVSWGARGAGLRPAGAAADQKGEAADREGEE